MENEEFVPATVRLNPNITSFYDFTLEDVIVEGYRHNGKYSYDTAI